MEDKNKTKETLSESEKTDDNAADLSDERTSIANASLNAESNSSSSSSSSNSSSSRSSSEEIVYPGEGKSSIKTLSQLYILGFDGTNYHCSIEHCSIGHCSIQHFRFWNLHFRFHFTY